MGDCYLWEKENVWNDPEIMLRFFFSKENSIQCTNLKSKSII